MNDRFRRAANEFNDCKRVIAYMRPIPKVRLHWLGAYTEQFLAKTEHDCLRRKEALPACVADAVAAAQATWAEIDGPLALAAAGFGGPHVPVRRRTRTRYWLDTSDDAAARAVVARIDVAVAPFGVGRSEGERQLIDYAVDAASGYSSCLGGPLAYGST